MRQTKLLKQFKALKEKIIQWESWVYSLGNECAYTDRMMEEIIDEAKKLEQIYHDQFSKDTYYILFEEQGYEQLIVKVEAHNENEAYSIANDAYLGDRIDRYSIESENLGRYDCAIIDQKGNQLEYGDCMENTKNESKEEQ